MSKRDLCQPAVYVLAVSAAVSALIVMGQPGDLGLLFREILLFLRGDIAPLRTDGGTAFSFITMTLGVALAVSLIINAISPPQKNGCEANLLSQHRGVAFIAFELPTTNFFEELLFRYLPLGVLATYWPGQTAYVVIFLMANVLWTVLHVPGNKFGMWLLQIFVGGIFYSYVFAKYGLVVVFLFHLSKNYLGYTLTMASLWFTKRFLLSPSR